ncbi:MAG TPA: hypothetical protein VF518_11790 [Polyangia bacterium]
MQASLLPAGQVVVAWEAGPVAPAWLVLAAEGGALAVQAMAGVVARAAGLVAPVWLVSAERVP